MKIAWVCLFTLILGNVRGQIDEPKDKTDPNSVSKPIKDGSNKSSQYNKQATSIFIKDEGLPEFGVLDGNELILDELPSIVSLNKTKATLNCASGYMGISLEFQQPFFGIVYANRDRNSACKITGNGNPRAEIQLPLKGCGTFQNPTRVFSNEIAVRFHPGLEIDGDEVISIICRYPSPVVVPPPPPAGLQLPILEEVRVLQPLRGFEVLLIICAIVFLSLLLLGMGCSYYCLKKRNIKVVKRRSVSTLGSEVTKISEPISMFDRLKIPRAHAEDTSGSEEVTESVRSNFASEVASTATEDDVTSAYSDAPFELMQGTVYPELHVPPKPSFDIRTKVSRGERGFSPISSKGSSESELILAAQEQYLTTILERTEVNTLETLERTRKSDMTTAPPPVHARVRVVNRRNISDTSELESESEYSQAATDVSDYYNDKLQLLTSEQSNMTVAADRRSEHLEYQNLHQHKPHRQMQYPYQSQDNLQGRRHEVHVRENHLENDLLIKNIEETLQKSTTTTEKAIMITPVIVERTALNLTIGDKRKVQPEVKNNFDVLIRILEAPISNTGGPTSDDDDVSSILTIEERSRIKEVITHDVEIKQFLQESHTTEKILMLKDYRQLGKIIEPQKWDVLIRIIDNSDILSMTRGSGSRESSAIQRISVESEAALDFRSTSDSSEEPGRYGEVNGMVTSYASQSNQYTSLSGTEVTQRGQYVRREAFYSSEVSKE